MRKIILACILVMAGLLMFAPVTQARPVIWGVLPPPPPPAPPVVLGIGPVLIPLIPCGWGPPPPLPPTWWAPPPPPRHWPRPMPPRPWR
jgi:hypothetical protein